MLTSGLAKKKKNAIPAALYDTAIEMNTIPGFNTFQLNSLLLTIPLRPVNDRCCMGVTV